MAILFVAQKGWGSPVLFPLANPNEIVGRVLGKEIGWI